MRYCLFSAAVLAVLGFGLTGGAAAPKDAAHRDVQDFVYMSEKGPMLIRFHVSIDGKPLMDVWEDFMGKLFAYLDLDGDGVLSKTEAARTPPVPVLFSNNPGFAGQQPNIAEAIDKDRDGKITWQELADWYRQNGAAPFQFRTNSPQQNQARLVLAGQPQTLSSDALNDKLFALLDADKNGKLSRDELAKAPALLAKMDADDDEMVSVAEMSGNAPSSMGNGVAFKVALDGASQPGNSGPFVMVTPGQGRKQLARELLNHYAPKGKRSAVRKLTRQDLGMDEAAFARLDMDEDGQLDSEELAHFAQRDADLEFRVLLGKKGGVELVPIKDQSSPLARAVRSSSGGTLILELGTTQIELGQGDVPRPAVPSRQPYLAQFRAADKDNNGYLDKSEAGQNRLYRGVFTMMDRDGDGKLFEKEVVAYLDKMEDLQKEAMGSCASLAVKDQGRGLFDLVDTNSDGRLGVRELRQMVKLIDSLDRDGDGQISRGEIPHKYRVDVRRGPANNNQLGQRVVVLRGMGANEPRPPERTAGPRWFRKMDRNRDGDVSRREFLGTDEQFRLLDADGDGLISVEEAERADKQLRKEKEQKP